MGVYHFFDVQYTDLRAIFCYSNGFKLQLVNQRHAFFIDASFFVIAGMLILIFSDMCTLKRMPDKDVKWDIVES